MVQRATADASLSEKSPRQSNEACPCCGQAWRPGRSKADARRVALAGVVNLGKIERLILDFLLDHFGTFATYRRIADSVYHLDPNGGPASAESVMCVLLTRRLESQLQAIGFRIERQRGAGLRLVWDTERDGAPAQATAAEC